MSLYDYRAGQQIELAGHPFYALIQAAMRQADTTNTELLANAFPTVYAELRARYNAPGGVLPSEIMSAPELIA